MPNGLNDLIDSLSGAGLQIGSAIIKHNRDLNLQSVYDSGVKRLNDLMNPQPTYQDAQGNPVSRGQSDISQGVTQVPGQYNPQQGLSSLYDTMNKLSQYGADANPQISMLQNIYQQGLPEKHKLETVGNTVLDTQVQKDGTYKITPVYTDHSKEKPPVKTAAEYKGMSLEDAQKLPPDEINNAYTYFNSDVQSQLKEGNAELQDKWDALNHTGSYAEKEPRGHTGHHSSFSAGKQNPEKLKAMTPEDLQGKDVSQLKGLWADANMLSGDTREELAKILGENPEVSKTKGKQTSEYAEGDYKQATHNKSHSEQSDPGTVAYFKKYIDDLKDIKNNQSEENYNSYKNDMLKHLEELKQYLTEDDYNYIFDNFN